MRPILIRAIIISLIVGSLLTLINQFERVTALELPNLWKMVLSYVVPFCVSLFSALAAKAPPRD